MRFNTLFHVLLVLVMSANSSSYGSDWDELTKQIYEGIEVSSYQNAEPPVDPYQILLGVLPERLQQLSTYGSESRASEGGSEDIITGLSVADNTTDEHLYANKYHTVEELVWSLIGDVKYYQEFNLSQPFNYYYEDIDQSKDLPVEALNEQLVIGLYMKLYNIYNELYTMFEIIEQMSEKDYVAVYDYVYHDSDDLLTIKGIEDGDISSWGIEDFEWESVKFDFSEIQDDEIPTPAEEYSDIDNNDSLVDQEVHAEIFLSLLKIPVIILKLILKIFWNLAQLKKLVKLAETKVILLIIRAIEKIKNIIYYIKMKIVFNIRLILYTVKSGLIFKKILAVVFLIIQKLRVLSWLLKDALYRYKWKLVFVVRRLKKKSLMVALFFKHLVYAKLHLMTTEEKRYVDFINPDDDYYSWDDYDYFEEFAHYVYSKPGTYKSEDKDLQKLVEENIEYDDTSKQDDQNTNGINFDLKEEYGFDSLRLNLAKFQKKPTYTANELALN